MPKPLMIVSGDIISVPELDFFGREIAMMLVLVS